ncbi:helix-turn-helix transcriptional regulator [Streptomyces sp. 21So2-11]|uniref:helix-turn-helix domain-containing protein n=1 Tax=Streptomyces sp. 21So2-11 TaxID=3144408 RepID=UPI00321A1A12
MFRWSPRPIPHYLIVDPRDATCEAELAERAGTGQAVISRIESGKLTPTLAVLERLAAALDCKVILDFAPRG